MSKHRLDLHAHDLYPHRCGTCGEPTITDGTLHTWSGRMGLPEKPYDHPATQAAPAARALLSQGGADRG